MKLPSIAIVGAGFTGLAAAWKLQQSGYSVSVFEATDHPGGLASGFDQPHWQWSLEHHYHHIFTSDLAIQSFLQDLGLDDQLFFQRVRTKTRYHGRTFQLDSPVSLLTCPILSPLTKLRMGAALAYLQRTEYQPWMEQITARDYVLKHMGKEAWEKIWQPLFVGKFGTYADSINAAWFWARIHVRTPQLGYVHGGFGSLCNSIVHKLEREGVQFHFSSPVRKIDRHNKQFSLTHIPAETAILHGKIPKPQILHFDKVLIAAPAPILHATVSDLPQSYVQSTKTLHSLGAITLVLELNQPFFSDNTYWLNVNEKDWPFLAVVEHTHFAPSDKYGNHHLLYVGKYLPPDSEQFSLSEEQLLKRYHPYLAKLSRSYHNHIVNSWVFRESFAQPITQLDHHSQVPSIRTPIDGLYWASMQHVYPWDRGTNYAVQIGFDAASTILTSTTPQKKSPDHKSA